MDDENPTPPLLATTPRPSAAEELLLLRFRSGLKWCALDLSSSVHRTASYLTFLIFTILIPITISHLLLPRLTTAAAVKNLSFNQLVQLPESSLAAIAFFTLSGDTSGIRQLLLLDGLLHDSAAVRQGYATRVDRTFRYLAAVLLPSFSVELAHKAVIFNAPSAAPLWRSAALAAAVASWVYRTGVFLLVCVLFRLTCELQILRFEELYEMFAVGGGASATEKVVAVMFREHARIRMQLTATSHMYRIFILGSLVTITVSQLGALMMVLSTKAEKNFSNSGDLVVCSVVQLSGFLMCLFGAARITHKAQRVVSFASRWHVIISSSKFKRESTADPHESDGQDCESVVGSLEPPVSQMHSSYESRQALVTYLQHNGGGITIFGFALDRSLLHTLFAFEMTLVLWILSKVVVLS